MKRASIGIGFTLVELMVVVTIIVVLLSMLLPAMEGAFEQARRASCASNLHAIQIAMVDYTLSNDGWFITRPIKQVQIVFIRGQPEVDQLAGIGLVAGTKTNVSTDPATVMMERAPSKLWDCPSRQYQSQWETGQLSVGYQYFGGIEFWLNPVYNGESRSPVRMQASKGSWVLAADTTMKIRGKWGDVDNRPSVFAGMPSHKDGRNLYPSGGNQVQLDGAVYWIDFEDMFYIHSWSTSRAAFFYQADIGGTPFLPATNYR